MEQQRPRLLPCAYYFLTFTLPAPLRALVYAQQKKLYGLLLHSAAAALQKLAWDPRYVGGQLAILAVLHTWRRDLLFHPHAHLLASAGGLSREGQHWVAAKNPAFLVPGFALGKIFKGKFKAGLKQLGLLHQAPAAVWQQDWNVHLQHAGRGEKVLDYLGRYAFRVALSNRRLQKFEHGQVTFGYRDFKTQQPKQCILSAEQFIERFLRHVLPKGLVKVRSYGLWNAHAKAKLQQARTLLQTQTVCTDLPSLPIHPTAPAPGPSLPLCPQCRLGHLILIASLLPQRTRAP